MLSINVSSARVRVFLGENDWHPPTEVITGAPRHVNLALGMLLRVGNIAVVDTPAKLIALLAALDQWYANALTEAEASDAHRQVLEHADERATFMRAPDPVLMGLGDDASTPSELAYFKVDLSELAHLVKVPTGRVGAYLLPRSVAATFGGEITEVIEVFDERTLGDALNLWVPGGDDFGQFDYCYKVAAAL